jgi:hypothetical protein
VVRQVPLDLADRRARAELLGQPERRELAQQGPLELKARRAQAQALLGRPGQPGVSGRRALLERASPARQGQAEAKAPLDQLDQPEAGRPAQLGLPEALELKGLPAQRGLREQLGPPAQPISFRQSKRLAPA